MNQALFFIIVAFIQFAISGLNLLIFFKHKDNGQYLAANIDMLCAISWFCTAMYKMWEFTLVIF